MPPSDRTASHRLLGLLVPIVGLDRVVQYIAGLATNALAPASGFTPGTDFGAYDVHWMNGYVLGILSIALVVVAGRSRKGSNIASSVVNLAAVGVAGFAGMEFVRTSPNSAFATITMGVAFLVCFSAVMAMMFRIRSSETGRRPPLDSVPSPG